MGYLGDVLAQLMMRNRIAGSAFQYHREVESFTESYNKWIYLIVSVKKN